YNVKVVVATADEVSPDFSLSSSSFDASGWAAGLSTFTSSAHSTAFGGVKSTGSSLDRKPQPAKAAKTMTTVTLPHTRTRLVNTPFPSFVQLYSMYTSRVGNYTWNRWTKD